MLCNIQLPHLNGSKNIVFTTDRTPFFMDIIYGIHSQDGNSISERPRADGCFRGTLETGHHLTKMIVFPDSYSNSSFSSSPCAYIDWRVNRVTGIPLAR